MATNIRRPARARMWKRIAIILASVSTVALVVFVIISFLPQSNADFTIRIDNPSSTATENHFHMAPTGEKGATPLPDLVKDKSLDHMIPKTAEEVEAYLKEIAKQGFSENQNWVTYKDAEKTTIDKGLAQVYTVYLVNDSATNDQPLKYSVNADSFTRGSTNDIVNYFRILIQTEIVGEENSMKNTYFGERHNDPNTAEIKNELGNDREPISTYQRSWDADKFVSIFKTNEGSEHETGYCNNFQNINENNKALVNAEEIVIPAGKTLRFTYVAYFEGEDVDCHGSIPAESYLLLSLHFGV